jgi:phosphoenolpyruvate carboxykinase (ATP)
MNDAGDRRSRYGLENHGIVNVDAIHWNLPTPSLYEEAVRRREGAIGHHGPLVVSTGDYTGRSPNDKFIVREPSCESNVAWGKVNKPFEPERFDRFYARLLAYLQRKDVFVQDCYAGADPRYRVPVRVITEMAWQNLFARNLFLFAKPEEHAGFVPRFTILATPRFHAVPEIDGTASQVYVIIHFEKRLVLIGGTSYAGEIKKSVFTILNYLLPLQGVLSMHCSANVGAHSDVALFFGLSGTGKTSLSADPRRPLIGDDEHAWSDDGVFNLEGGCYAKVIRIRREAEPDIYATTRRFGTVLENVAIDPRSRRIDLDDDRLTENTRAAYPISHISNAVRSGMGGHPRHVVFLACDAWGVLPPISRLTPEQAMFHYLSGYTAKVAGTERGVKEPTTTFSACFGAPFLPLRPTVYADLLGKKISHHGARCWLVNTGWTGGAFGTGKRMPIQHTRALLHAALEGRLDSVPVRKERHFGLEVPTACPDIPAGLLDPRSTWPDPAAYDAQAAKLAGLFRENFRAFEGAASPGVRAAAPGV